MIAVGDGMIEHNFRDDLRRAVDELGISPETLSLEAGLNPSAARQILTGKSRNPRSDTLEKLSRAVQALRLKTGRLATGDREEMITIAELDVKAAAGDGFAVDSEHCVANWRVPRTWLHAATTATPGAIRIITVHGDSMAPTLQPGERVMIDTADRSPSPSGIFIVWDGLGLIAKRLEHAPHSKPPTVRVISDNPHYERYEVKLSDLEIRGRVIGKWLWT